MRSPARNELLQLVGHGSIHLASVRAVNNKLWSLECHVVAVVVGYGELFAGLRLRRSQRICRGSVSKCFECVCVILYYMVNDRDK